MKKISTLGFGILISVASMANYAPSRLTVFAESNATIKVMVDDNRFDQQSASNSVVFENLQPGFHAVKVYQLNDNRFGFNGRRRGDDYRLVYNASVNIKPLFATTIELSRFGNAQINEQPLRGYDNNGWRNDDRRRGDHSYNNGNRYETDRDYSNGYDNNSGYSRAISNEDFFAAERVLQHENFDDARLLYAKQVIDDNCVSAEQVKELARFFSFDNNRLDFVKYAYSKTADKNNFSVVCNAFSSTSGREQVMIFLRGCR